MNVNKLSNFLNKIILIKGKIFSLSLKSQTNISRIILFLYMNQLYNFNNKKSYITILYILIINFNNFYKNYTFNIYLNIKKKK